jgi:hypothetical protein
MSIHIRVRAFLRRVVAAVVAARPRSNLTPEHVLEAIERTDVVLRVLRAVERDELARACREALAAEDVAAGRVRCRPEHAVALTDAERRVAAQWRLVWGDPPVGVEPRRLGAWAELRRAQVVAALAPRAGADPAAAEARLRAARAALVHALPAQARKLVAEVLV